MTQKEGKEGKGGEGEEISSSTSWGKEGRGEKSPTPLPYVRTWAHKGEQGEKLRRRKSKQCMQER